MRFPSRIRFLALAPLLFAAYAPAAWSQACSPFTDIQVSDSFCNAAIWLRNASVTVGCTGEAGVVQYCPTPAVTRAQMALFLHRMSAAVSPGIGFVESSLPPEGDLDTGNGVVLCETPDVHGARAVRNPRYWHAEGNVSFRAATAAPVDVQVRLVSRVTYPDTSTETNVANEAIPNASAAAGAWGTVHVMAGPGNLMHPGEAWTFYLQLYRSLGSSTTAELGQARCQLKITTTDLAILPESSAD